MPKSDEPHVPAETPAGAHLLLQRDFELCPLGPYVPDTLPSFSSAVKWGTIVTPTRRAGRSKHASTHRAPRPGSDRDGCSVNGRAVLCLHLRICQGLPGFSAVTKASVTCLFLFVWPVLSYPPSLSLTVNPLEIFSDQIIQIIPHLFNAIRHYFLL